MAARASLSKTFVWIILALLILGLAGFGATNLSGTIRTVGHVGDKYIDVDDYARSLQQEIRAIEAQTGQALPFDQALSLGLDRAVLSRLVTTRALDNEAAQLGLSIGDENLREQIVQIPAFSGVDGQFDREGYRFLLEQRGMTEARFEESIRDESARTLLQAAMVTGVDMPETFTETLMTYVGQRRSFTWTTLDRSKLETSLASASESQITQHYEENIDRFSLPETKQITYAMLTPDMILDQVEVDEDALRQLYEERANEYNQPERRLVERLVFATDAEASAAMAALEVSGTTYEALVEERGLALADVDLGDVTAQDMGAAGEAVFAADVGDVVGPAPSPLGPALFRVNGVLPAINTSFEDARPDLQEDLAADRARRVIEAQAQSIDDMLAGGATLEEVAAETDMELGQIDWFDAIGEGIAAYNDFNEAAIALSADDFPQINGLDDGGMFAMRLDAVLPPRPAPLPEVRRDVIADWENSQLLTQLRTQAEAAVPELESGKDFADVALDAVVETDLIRSAFVPGTPPEFMTRVFDMAVDEVAIVDSEQAIIIVRLDGIAEPDDSVEMNALRDGLGQQMDQALAQDLFEIFARDVQLRANPTIDQRAINAVHSSFQ
jgi:peptidyl-prolyl cis-trans isomerase D